MPQLTVDRAYWEWKASVLPEEIEGSVLDIGCYRGHFSYLSRERGASQVIGIEPPIDGIEADYDSLPLISQEGVVFERLSIYDSPILGHFDHIIFFDVLYHLTSPLLGLQSLKKCLLPGGSIYLCSLVADGEIPILIVLEEGYADDSTNWFVPTVLAIEVMCRRVGLTFEKKSRRGDRVLGTCHLL